jgi:N-acetyl-gamma-glutamyl-phosphate reductase
MLSTIYVSTERSEGELKNCLQDFYQDAMFVRIVDGLPATKNVRGTNRCLISLSKNMDSGRATIISVIDNLTKGASGQAVQNMNLMFGMDEAAGLDYVPVFP